MNNLTSYMVLNLNGMDRITYTYDVIDDSTGDIISQNNKASFFVTDENVKNNLDAIKKYINENKL